MRACGKKDKFQLFEKLMKTTLFTFDFVFFGTSSSNVQISWKNAWSSHTGASCITKIRTVLIFIFMILQFTKIRTFWLVQCLRLNHTVPILPFLSSTIFVRVSKITEHGSSYTRHGKEDYITPIPMMVCDGFPPPRSTIAILEHTTHQGVRLIIVF